MQSIENNKKAQREAFSPASTQPRTEGKAVVSFSASSRSNRARRRRSSGVIAQSSRLAWREIVWRSNQQEFGPRRKVILISIDS